MIFDRAPEFDKDLKALQKSWPSLTNDLRVVEKVVEALYLEHDGADHGSLRKAFFDNKRATVLSKSESGEVVKTRLDCASLGNKDIIRLIFIYYYDKQSALFIELYSKSDKDREDTTRIKRYLR